MSQLHSLVKDVCDRASHMGDITSRDEFMKFPTIEEQIENEEAELSKLSARRAQLERDTETVRFATREVKAKLADLRKRLKAERKKALDPARADKDRVAAEKRGAAVSRWMKAYEMRQSGISVAGVAEFFGVSSARARDLIRNGERLRQRQEWLLQQEQDEDEETT